MFNLTLLSGDLTALKAISKPMFFLVESVDTSSRLWEKTEDLFLAWLVCFPRVGFF